MLFAAGKVILVAIEIQEERGLARYLSKPFSDYCTVISTIDYQPKGLKGKHYKRGKNNHWVTSKAG